MSSRAYRIDNKIANDMSEQEPMFNWTHCSLHEIYTDAVSNDWERNEQDHYRTLFPYDNGGMGAPVVLYAHILERCLELIEDPKYKKFHKGWEFDKEKELINSLLEHPEMDRYGYLMFYLV